MTETDAGWFQTLPAAISRSFPQWFGDTNDMLVPFDHIHSSGRYDRTVTSLRRATRGYIKEAGVVTYTEMQRDAKRAALMGWDGHQMVIDSRGKGSDECAALIDRSVWKVESPRAIRLSTIGVKARGGQLNHALTFGLEHIATGAMVGFSVVHARNTDWKDDGYQADLDTLRSIHGELRSRYGKVVSTGDWNMNLRSGSVRAAFEDEFPKLSSAWQGQIPAIGGTHNNALIDGSFTDLSVKSCRLFRDDPSSDHRPFIETLRLPTGAKG